jgi:iron(III) transport system substrate-binding protein
MQRHPFFIFLRTGIFPRIAVDVLNRRLIVSVPISNVRFKGMRMFRQVFLAVAGFLSLTRVTVAAENDAVVEAAKKEGALVFYTSMTADQGQKVLGAFRARYPFIQPQIFRAVGERLLTKIMTEVQAGKYDFDVVQSAETQAYFLKRKNLLLKYVSPEVKYLQKPFFDSDGFWAAVYIMPNVIGYNTRMLKKNEVPRTDEDLINPKWKGKIGMDHTKPEWFAWKLKRMGEKAGPAYMKKLGAQEFKLYAGQTILTNLLAAGEFPLVLNTYVHTAEDIRRKGAPVDWVAQDPVFTKFQPIGVGAKASHPNAAKLFIDFVLSEEGQKLIASFGRVPTRRGVPTTVQGLDKLSYVVDEISAGDDYNKNYELFRAVFNAPKN